MSLNDPLHTQEGSGPLRDSTIQPEPSNIHIEKSKEMVKDSLKEIWNKRLVHKGNYTIDKVIFNVCILLVFGFLWYCAFYYQYDLDSYECMGSPVDTCRNPFYKPSSWKNLEYVAVGKYGADLSKGPFKRAGLISFLILLSAFVLNHFLYNRGKIDLKKLSRQINEE